MNSIAARNTTAVTAHMSRLAAECSEKRTVLAMHDHVNRLASRDGSVNGRSDGGHIGAVVGQSGRCID